MQISVTVTVPDRMIDQQVIKQSQIRALENMILEAVDQGLNSFGYDLPAIDVDISPFNDLQDVGLAGYNPSMFRMYQSDGPLEDSTSGGHPTSVRQQVEKSLDANLIGSKFLSDPNKHAIFLDIDCKMIVKKSKTPGHSHVIFPNSSVSFEKYVELLDLLVDLGIIQGGYRDFTKQRGQAFLRAYPTEHGFSKAVGPPEGWGKEASARNLGFHTS